MRSNTGVNSFTTGQNCSPKEVVMKDEVFRPGDRVPCSGVFHVAHRNHRDAHEATLGAGGSFPPCAVCGDGVRFRLVKEAADLKSDTDFLNKG